VSCILMRDTALRLLLVRRVLRLALPRHDGADRNGHGRPLEVRDPVGEAFGEALRAAEPEASSATQRLVPFHCGTARVSKP